MAGIPTLLEVLLEHPPGHKLQVKGVSTKNEYETIRTALSRKWAEHREVIVAITGDGDPLSTLALCGNWRSNDNLAVFYLGVPRRRLAKSYEFSISPSPPSSSGLDNSENQDDNSAKAANSTTAS